MLNRLKLTAIATASVALIAVACGSVEAVTVVPPTVGTSSPNDEPVSEVTETSGHIWLVAPTGDHQRGWGNLIEEDGVLKVEVDVQPAEPVAQPAHIHEGTCDQLGPIVYRLENIVGGHSMTELPDVTMEDLATGNMAINLHLSFADFATFTACGEIPALPQAD